MLKERSGGGRVILAANERRKGRDAARLPQSLKDGPALAGLIRETGSSGGVGDDGSRRMLQQLGVKEGERLFKRVRLGTGNSSLDRSCVKAVSDQSGDQEVNGILESAGIVASISEHNPVFRPEDGRRRATLRSRGRRVRTSINGGIDLVLVLELGTHVVVELGRFEVLAQLGGALEE